MCGLRVCVVCVVDAVVFLLLFVFAFAVCAVCMCTLYVHFVRWRGLVCVLCPVFCLCRCLYLCWACVCVRLLCVLVLCVCWARVCVGLVCVLGSCVFALGPCVYWDRV